VGNMQTNELKHISRKDKSPLIWGLFFGILFGFLLQKGGATKYDVIIGQLLLSDFTVLKIMLSAVLTGMVGIYLKKGDFGNLTLPQLFNVNDWVVVVPVAVLIFLLLIWLERVGL
jgi:hypothetical protein